MAEQELIEADGGDLEAPSGLTKLEEAFSQAYALVESPSYGRVVESAAAAGYESARNAGWRLMRRPRVRARITQLQRGARAAAEKILSDLEHTRLASMEKGDLATSARCSQLQGQALGLFYERNLLTVEDTPSYDPILAREAVRITAILLRENPDLKPPPGGDGAAVGPAVKAQEPPPQPAARATAEEIERAQAPRERQGE